ncbi:MAG: 16S rRNA (cytidine(1402)-2'-O)-methyltransferase [Terriglobales bacterium]
MTIPPSTPGTLYLVATPVGNLEDMTLRGLRLLREADVIACEDTRQTRKLLNHFEIQRPTISYHEHNERERTAELLPRLQAGECVALVSDAGVPTLSDPGLLLVQAAIAAGVPVVPVPGASAIVLALTASGLAVESFCFRGFLPPRTSERRRALERVARQTDTLVWFESPHRLCASLADMAAVLGPDRPVVVARELTKLHEEFVRGTVASAQAHFALQEPRGEFTLVVGGWAEGQAPAATTEQDLVARMTALLAQPGMDERSALKLVAREWSIAKSEVYRRWQACAAGKAGRSS